MDDFFPETFETPDLSPERAAARAKKKADLIALQSPFMRVPYMRVEVARALIDGGLRQLYELEGRSPEALYEQIKSKRPELKADMLPYIRLAVYCAETPDRERDRDKLHPHAWRD